MWTPFPLRLTVLMNVAVTWFTGVHTGVRQRSGGFDMLSIRNLTFWRLTGAYLPGRKKPDQAPTGPIHPGRVDEMHSCNSVAGR